MGVSPAGLPTAVVNAHIRSRHEATIFRGGELRPSRDELLLASWNVEGLTDAKVVQLRFHMKEMAIGVLCLQETHRCKSDYYITDQGYLVILLGAATSDEHETAGVGFMISPRLRQVIIGFR